jgi:hypothetical protein
MYYISFYNSTKRMQSNALLVLKSRLLYISEVNSLTGGFSFKNTELVR